MTDSLPLTLVDILVPFWDSFPQDAVQDIINSKKYNELKAHCVAHYDSLKNTIFIDNYLCRALCLAGVPCFVRGNINSEKIIEAAIKLDAELTKTIAEKIYLSPLDCAGYIEPIHFGNAEIKTFSAEELYDILGQKQLERLFPHKKIDLERLSRFNWLMVRDTVTLIPDITKRNFSYLDIGFDHDYGAIKPYHHSYPKAFQYSLFSLLLAPWEHWVESESDWRAFYIPWVHTVEDDLFVAQKLISDSDSLTWIEQIRIKNGELIEVSEPLEIDLSCGDDELGKHFHKQLFDHIDKAIKNGFINEAAIHHFLKAFLSRDIDEFLAHIVVIDACLGDSHELKNELESLKVGSNNLPKTGKLKYRLVGLLNDASVKNEIDNLYDLRSKYVHGRDMEVINSKEKIQARSLARRTLMAIITIAGNNPEINKSEMLNMLLRKGNGIILS